MIIILEGCNKSGKTTLANKMKEITDFEYIKCSQPKIENGINQAYNEYMDIIKNIDKNKNYIIDRFHFGSYVYGPIYRGKPDFDLTSFVKIEQELEKLNVILILCVADKNFMKKKYEEENEEFAKIELIDEEIRLFNEVSKMSRLFIMKHKLPKKDNTDKILKLIKQYV